jgi:hypothetical protein
VWEVEISRRGRTVQKTIFSEAGRKRVDVRYELNGVDISELHWTIITHDALEKEDRASIRKRDHPPDPQETEGGVDICVLHQSLMNLSPEE